MHCWKQANPALGKFLQGRRAPLGHADDAGVVLPPAPARPVRRRRPGPVDRSGGRGPGCADRRDIEPGSPIVLAFDGSRNGDSTVLLAVTIEQVPHVQPIAVWASEGKPEGWSVPVAEVEAKIIETCGRFKVAEVIADPYLWIGSLQSLARQGVPVAEFPQSAQRMTPATSGTYQAAVNGNLTHNGDPVLTEHVMNARCIEDHRGTRLSKPGRSHHETRRIDLAVALVMGWARATHWASQPAKKSRAGSWTTRWRAWPGDRRPPVSRCGRPTGTTAGARWPTCPRPPAGPRQPAGPLGANYVSWPPTASPRGSPSRGSAPATRSCPRSGPTGSARGMERAHKVAILEALVLGQSFLTTWADADGQPVISVDTPREMAITRNPLTREISSALKRWRATDGTALAVLFRPRRSPPGPVRRAGGRGAPRVGWDTSETLPNPLAWCRSST